MDDLRLRDASLPGSVHGCLETLDPPCERVDIISSGPRLLQDSLGCFERLLRRHPRSRSLLGQCRRGHREIDLGHLDLRSAAPQEDSTTDEGRPDAETEGCFVPREQTFALLLPLLGDLLQLVLESEDLDEGELVEPVGLLELAPSVVGCGGSVLGPALVGVDLAHLRAVGLLGLGLGGHLAAVDPQDAEGVGRLGSILLHHPGLLLSRRLGGRRVHSAGDHSSLRDPHRVVCVGLGLLCRGVGRHQLLVELTTEEVISVLGAEGRSPYTAGDQARTDADLLPERGGLFPADLLELVPEQGCLDGADGDHVSSTPSSLARL